MGHFALCVCHHYLITGLLGGKAQSRNGGPCLCSKRQRKTDQVTFAVLATIRHPFFNKWEEGGSFPYAQAGRKLNHNIYFNLNSTLHSRQPN